MPRAISRDGRLVASRSPPLPLTPPPDITSIMRAHGQTSTLFFQIQKPRARREPHYLYSTRHINNQTAVFFFSPSFLLFVSPSESEERAHIAHSTATRHESNSPTIVPTAPAAAPMTKTCAITNYIFSPWRDGENDSTTASHREVNMKRIHVQVLPR